MNNKRQTYEVGKAKRSACLRVFRMLVLSAIAMSIAAAIRQEETWNN
jgi:hypothetical protein